VLRTLFITDGDGGLSEEWFGVHQETVDRGLADASIDRRKPTNAPGRVKRYDPVSIYGSKPNGYIVVNIRTGEVAQLADRNNPDWIPDGRIAWN
jgi:hypothetical protein